MTDRVSEMKEEEEFRSKMSGFQHTLSFMISLPFISSSLRLDLSRLKNSNCSPVSLDHFSCLFYSFYLFVSPLSLSVYIYRHTYTHISGCWWPVMSNRFRASSRASLSCSPGELWKNLEVHPKCQTYRLKLTWWLQRGYCRRAWWTPWQKFYILN